jgi:hypothetical protein
MGHYNPRRVFPINMCGPHGSSNQNNYEPSTHLGLRLIRCCAAKTYSSRSSMCICDWESMSPKPSSSAILHRERVNKVFEKRSSRLLARFVMFFTTAHLPLHRSYIDGHRLQREPRQTNRRLYPIVIIKEPQVTYDSYYQIMSYIFNMLICMILLNNLL